MRPRVKICCIQSEEEAAIAIGAGADAIGIVGRGLSGPEVIEDDERIAAIAATAPPGVDTFLLTRESDPQALARQVHTARCSVVQICDAVSPSAYEAVRELNPCVRIVQVVHVTGEGAIRQAAERAELVDAILLDSGSPSGPNPVFGGTGATHDWAISAAIVRLLDTPVFLAGGLNRENVIDAYSRVYPWGLDLCSGVRTDGALDAQKVQAFIARTRYLN